MLSTVAFAFIEVFHIGANVTIIAQFFFFIFRVFAYRPQFVRDNIVFQIYAFLKLFELLMELKWFTLERERMCPVKRIGRMADNVMAIIGHLVRPMENYDGECIGNSIF